MQSAVLWAAALVAVAAALSVQQLRISHLKAQHAQTLQGIAEKTVKAQTEIARYIEDVGRYDRKTRKTLEEQERKAREENEALGRAADAERAGRLRSDKLLAQRTRDFQSLARSAATAAEREATADAIGVLADVLGRADERAGILAAAADQARARGAACERAYDTVADRINAGPQAAAQEAQHVEAR
ncbi:DUF2514 family protein [Delftia sp. WSY_13]